MRQYFARRALSFFAFFGLSVCLTQSQFQHTVFTPWTDAHMDAVVRIEISTGNPRAVPSVGTGFIVQGPDRHFVVTSSHHLFGLDAPRDYIPDCKMLNPRTIIYRRERAAEQLSFNPCAWNIGNDVAVIELAARQSGYPFLQLSARKLSEFERVYPAGYPNGGPLDRTRDGEISSIGTSDGVVTSDSLTMDGMSGGPYLSQRGKVVGVHSGNVLYRAGFAKFVNVIHIKSQLENKVGTIPFDNEPLVSIVTDPNQIASEYILGTIIQIRKIEKLTDRIDVFKIIFTREPTDQERALLGEIPTEIQSVSQNSIQQGIRDIIKNYEVAGGFDVIRSGHSSIDRPPELKNDVESINKIKAKEAEQELLRNIKAGKNGDFIKCQDDSARIIDGKMVCEDSDFILFTNQLNSRPIVPKLIVLHDTWSGSFKQTVAWLRSASSSGSYHFVIDRDGSVAQLVRTTQAAAHAGQSSWQELTSINNHSIGIAFINSGRLTRDVDGRFKPSQGSRTIDAKDVASFTHRDSTIYWHRHTAEQIAMANVISKAIMKEYSIRAVVGHCSVSRRNNVDPSPVFPLFDFGQRLGLPGQPNCRI